MDWQQLLANSDIEQVPLAALIAIFVILIYRGGLVPKVTVDDVRKERDSWKSAYLNESKAGTVKDGQISELMEVARSAQHMYRSLPGGDSHVVEATQPHSPQG
jgi:hypothetical protein